VTLSRNRAETLHTVLNRPEHRRQALRFTGWLAGIAPGAVAAAGRRLGSAEVAEQLGERQRSKR
jgi:hypothetical protein